MKQRLAIIGADPSQGLLIKKAKEMNIHTICFGLEAGSTCKDLCDEFHIISVTDKEAIYNVCKDLKIDGIISIAFDLAMPTINYVADKLGLVGNSMKTTLYTINKAAMRKVLKTHGLPVPKFHICKGIRDKHILKYPFMVKAAQSAASRGITLVNNKSEYYKAYKNALDYSNEVVLEEYFEGRQYSVEMISKNGEHHFVGFSEVFYSGTPYFVDEDSITPGRIEDKLLNELVELVSKSLNAMAFKNGATHSELRINNNNEFCIIEIAGRMGGNRPEFIELSYGINYIKALINIVLGNEFNLDKDGTAS
ncbi:MAG: ATP-grasp domain-containing protein, partial [Flavobacteriales bacterium]|nr:ATP-grasp domain-containing protein [Flavobacteriales bacterium]